MSIPVLLTVRQFSQKHPAFPEGGLRHHIFHANENGMNAHGVIVRAGRRVLISETEFFIWIKGGSSSASIPDSNREVTND